MSGITSKNFGTKLSAMLRSAKTQRDNVQAIIVFGLTQFSEHGDTGYLTRLVNGCVGVRSMPTRTIQQYIQGHANMVYSKSKDGEPVFKKVGKKVEVTMPTETWYDWEDGVPQAKPMDVMAQVKSMITRIKTAQDNQGVTDGEQTDTILADLTKLVA